MATVALLAPAGCSIGADNEPQPVTGTPKQIAATVDRLGRAIAAEDFAEVCERIYTPAARKRAGGADCAKHHSCSSSQLRQVHT